MSAGRTGVVCDIGGTNCRFALVESGMEISAVAAVRCAESESFEAALAAYLADEGQGAKPSWAVIAVAGPIDDGVVQMTNRAWRIAAAEIAQRFGMDDVRLVNDFAALAAATPHLRRNDLLDIGAPRPSDTADIRTFAIVGPGTGLGVGASVRGPFGDVVLPSEGGHASFAPLDQRERDIARILGAKFEHLSCERIISGQGLQNIDAALRALDGAPELALTPSEIATRARENSDPVCVETFAIFTRALGAFAGDVVLTLGARFGLYLAGGVLTKNQDLFDHAVFRERFEAKGRFRAYLRETPVWLIAQPHSALVGAAALARQFGLATA